LSDSNSYTGYVRTYQKFMFFQKGRILIDQLVKPIEPN
jgi:hypothetical protein